MDKIWILAACRSVYSFKYDNTGDFLGRAFCDSSPPSDGDGVAVKPKVEDLEWNWGPMVYLLTLARETFSLSIRLTERPDPPRN